MKHLTPLVVCIALYSVFCYARIPCSPLPFSHKSSYPRRGGEGDFSGCFRRFERLDR